MTIRIPAHDPTRARPAAPVTDAPAAGRRPLLTPGTYRVDPGRTSVEFAIKELFGLMTTRGTFEVTDGVIEVAADPTASSVRVRLDAGSFATDKARRDEQVKGPKFLAVATYPEMSFASTALAHTTDGWRLTGLLTAHGVPSPVVLSLVDGGQVGDTIRVVATARVDRYAFGVRVAPTFIGRYLDTRIEVVAVR